MRKLIVKLFALDYIVKIGSKKLGFTRSANFIFPSLLATMTLSATHNPYWWVGLVFFFIFVFFGFVYFRIKPLQTEDVHHFDDPQLYAWFVYHNYRYKTEPTRYNGFWVLLVNPICIIIFLFVLFSRLS